MKDVRETIEQAEKRLGEQDIGTILFLDEVHRFNKAQQDALLPSVETGLLILIGATTENPFFEVTNHKHKKRCETFPHFHKVTNELNYIVSGELKVDGKFMFAGDMWIYEPNEVSNVEFLEDSELIIVRWPSIPSDKYPA